MAARQNKEGLRTIREIAAEGSASRGERKQPEKIKTLVMKPLSEEESERFVQERVQENLENVFTKFFPTLSRSQIEELSNLQYLDGELIFNSDDIGMYVEVSSWIKHYNIKYNDIVAHLRENNHSRREIIFGMKGAIFDEIRSGARQLDDKEQKRGVGIGRICSLCGSDNIGKNYASVTASDEAKDARYFCRDCGGSKTKPKN